MSTCRKIILLFCCINCFINFAEAQGKYNNNWVIGCTNSFVVNFDNGIPTVSIFDSIGTLCLVSSHSSVSDSIGNLIMYCTGSRLFNNHDSLIENGDSLIDNKYYAYSGGDPVLTQGSAIVLPFIHNIYKLITTSVIDSGWTSSAQLNHLLMHTVDMNINNGRGKVIIKKRVITDSILYARVGMTACRHANGIDWWLIKQGANANNIYSFFISKDSIAKPIKNSFGSPLYNIYDRSGQLALTIDGTKIANTQEQPNQVFVGSFDRCYGTVGNPKTYNIPALLIDSFYSTTQLETLPRGLCFSPNGQYLYVIMRSKIFQLDLTEPDSAKAWYLVSSLDTLPAYFQQYATAYLAPNNKIYIGNWNGLGTTMNVIDNPDGKNTLCNFCKRCLRFSKNGVSCPPNQINYNLGAISPPCAPLVIKTIAAPKLVLTIFPNPAQSTLYINLGDDYNGKASLNIEDAIGKKMMEKDLQFAQGRGQVNVSSLIAGVYSLQVLINGVKEVVKFVKE